MHAGPKGIHKGPERRGLVVNKTGTILAFAWMRPAYLQPTDRTRLDRLMEQILYVVNFGVRQACRVVIPNSR